MLRMQIKRTACICCNLCLLSFRSYAVRQLDNLLLTSSSSGLFSFRSACRFSFRQCFFTMSYMFFGVRECEAHVRMEPQSPSSKIARFADTEELGGESLSLGLGLGPARPHEKSGFTFLQLQELEHQALIFKYMVAGVPVPSHLVIPIWKSFVSSNSWPGIYPSFMGCRGVCLDYRNTKETEPGRCRRTDGKKWRCSKDVVPNQKYCERHMHRGRNRSRKHVETTSQTTNAASSNNTNDSNINLSISIPLQLLNSTTNDNSSSNVSPRSGFSPKSVLQSGTCKTESSL